MSINTSSNPPPGACVGASPPHDDEASALYRQYYAALFRRIYLSVRNHERAEDLTQETFLRAWRALPTRREGPLSAWLYRIARNLLCDEWRRGQRVSFCSLDEEDAPEPVDERADPQRGGCAERELIAAALAQLSPRHRQVLTAWYHDQAYNRQALYRARAAFKQAYLQAQGGGDAR